MDRLVLIDGHAILHRAYHAYPPLTTLKGELVNAVYGFSSILLTVLREINPEYVAVAFDKKGPTFRHQQYTQYKASRPKMDQELEDQIKRVEQVVKTLNIPIFSVQGFEADDVIGTLAKQACLKLKAPASALDASQRLIQPCSARGATAGKQSSPACLSADRQDRRGRKLKATTQNSKLKENLEVVIVTGDQDALQLINDKVRVYMPGRGKIPPRIFNKEEVLRKYGLEPKQIIDLKALAGDASDEIPGVRGIGPKTAQQLIKKFGTMEKIYEALRVEINKENDRRKHRRKQRAQKSWRSQQSLVSSVIRKSIQERLIDGVESAALSKSLATIVTDVPINLVLEKCRLLDYDKKKVIKLFKELEFKSLLKKLPEEGWEEKPDRKKATLKTLEKTEETENEKQMELF